MIPKPFALIAFRTSDGWHEGRYKIAHREYPLGVYTEKSGYYPDGVTWKYTEDEILEWRYINDRNNGNIN